MKFIAHRGFSKRFPENSLQAFNAVLEHSENGRSIIGIELDVHPTADHHIMVMHDTMIRDENGKNIAIGRISFDRLQNLFLLNRPHAGHRVPEFGEVCELVSHKTGLCIEIKDSDYDRDHFCGMLADALGAYGAKNDIVISSFSADILRRIIAKTAGAGLKFAFLFSAWDEWETLPADIRPFLHYAQPRFDIVQAFPLRLSAVGLPVHTWVINDPEDMEILASLPAAHKIQAVFTDDITLAERFGER